MPKKGTGKSKKLPKIGTQLRSLLIFNVCQFEDYQNNLDKGIRIFTYEELIELKNTYEKGMTWDDIDRELSQKGILLKKATFRKYIQNQYLPGPFTYRKTEKGRMAVFPSDTIAHINFIQYFYKVASGEIIDNILYCLQYTQISYLEAVESFLTWRDNLYASILHYVCFDDDSEVTSALSKGLANEPKDLQKALNMVEQADNAFQSHVVPKIDAIIEFLKSKTLFPTDLQEKKEGQE